MPPDPAPTPTTVDTAPSAPFDAGEARRLLDEIDHKAKVWCCTHADIAHVTIHLRAALAKVDELEREVEYLTSCLGASEYPLET